MARNPKPMRRVWKAWQAWMRGNGWRATAKSKPDCRYDPELLGFRRFERTQDGFQGRYVIQTRRVVFVTPESSRNQLQEGER